MTRPADAESASDETDTNSEDRNEVGALDSRLDHDRTHAADGKNDDTDESESEVERRLWRQEQREYRARVTAREDAQDRARKAEWDARMERLERVHSIRLKEF